MIHELKPHQFHKAASIFTGPKQYIPVLAVLTGRFPGRVYVDHPVSPKTALVWALSRWAYIDGDPSSTGFTSSFLDLIRDVLSPASLQMGTNWFELYARGSRDWVSVIESSLSALKPDKHNETVSVLDLEAYRRLRKAPGVPSGWKLQLSDIPFIPKGARDSGLIPVELARQTAFGYRLLDGDRIVAVCKSIGFEADNEFMVEVETFNKEDRGKGYATLVATTLIDHALGRGLSPLWETTEDNIPSQRLAQRLGFVQTESYPVYMMKITQREDVQ